MTIEARRSAASTSCVWRAAMTSGERTVLQLTVDIAGSLSAVVAPCFGPRGASKALTLDGHLLVTRNSSVLIRHCKSDHPIAEMIQQAASVLWSQVFDGVCSQLLLTHGLLHEAQEAVKCGVHPCVVRAGYLLCLRRAIDLLGKFRMPIGRFVDAYGEHEFTRLVCLGSLRTRLDEPTSGRLAPLCARLVAKAHAIRGNSCVALLDASVLGSSAAKGSEQELSTLFRFCRYARPPVTCHRRTCAHTTLVDAGL